MVTQIIVLEALRGIAIAKTLPVKDRIETNTITEKLSVAIEVRGIEPIPTPADPYSYR